MKFIVETSARHVHVSKADLETLFGAGYELTKDSLGGDAVLNSIKLISVVYF